MTTPSPNVAHLRWSSHAQSLQSVFQDLYSQQALVDVTLACRGGSVKAHKVVLSAVSPYFRRLFAESSCRHPIVILRDVDVVMVEGLLNYVYGSDVQVTEMAWRTLCDTAQILGMSESLFVKPEHVNPASEGQTLGCEFLTPKDNHHSKLVIDQQQKRNSIVKCEENQELEHTRAAKRTLPLAKESEAVGDRTADESTDAMRKPNEVNGDEVESYSEEDYEITKETYAATEEPLSQKRKIGAKEEPVLRNAKHRRKPIKRIRKEIQRVPMDLSKISNEDSVSQAVATPLPESPVPLLIKPEIDLDTKSDDGDERENTESESLLNATADHYPFSVLEEQVSGSLVVQAICPFCFKDCKRTAELRAHIRAHTGEKPFRCDICNAPFARSAHLKRHRRVHTGERPFECVRCQKAFSRQDKLKLHMDRHRLRELGGKMTLGRPRKEKLTSPSNAQPANYAAPKNRDDSHNSDSEPPSSLSTTPTSSSCSTTPLSTTVTGGELGMGQFAFPGTPASSARPSSSSSPSPLSSGLTSPSSLSGSMPYKEMSYLSLLTLSQRGLGMSSSDLSSSSSVLPHLLHHHQALQLYQNGLKANMGKRGPNSRNQQVNNGAHSKGLTTHESAAESLLSLVQQMGEAQTLPPPAHS